MTNITENLQLVRQRIELAAAAAGRDAGQIRLLAVSKKQPAAAIRQAVGAGQRHFGENYPQEALQKMQALTDLDARWHFIGRLQSNKTGTVARNFHWLHSLSRSSIARRLSEQRPSGLRALQVCIQVRIGEESSKAGVDPDQVAELADTIVRLPGLELRGLMCLPPYTENVSEQRKNFASLRSCFAKLRDQGYEIDTLSMGMSGDLEAAIAEGATCVRVGTAIFGPRI